MKAILVGATGLIGKHLLNQLLNSEKYTKLKVLSRKKIALEHPKLVQVIVNFDQLSNYKDEFDADAVFCTLGTTMKKAGSKEAFITVDYTYPLTLAKICSEKNIPQFHLVTAMGASSNSAIFYNKVKGDIESAISKLNLLSVFIYRPSMLIGHRNEVRNGEKIGQVIMQFLNFAFIGPLKKYRAIKGETVATAMLKQSLQASKGVMYLESDTIENCANS